MWYKRTDAQRRFTVFYTSLILAGAFGGLLAYGIGHMDGVGGKKGWQWIFILEGLLTAVVGILFFFFFPDFPEEAKWLTRAHVKAKLAVEQGNSGTERHIRPKDVVHFFKDIKVWFGGFMYFAILIPGYSYAYFAPTIIKQLGYSALKTQLYSVPPWAGAFGWTLLLAYLSDKTSHRFGYIFISTCLSIAGTGALLGVYTNTNVQYGMLFLFVMGIYGAVPMMSCWFTMNLAGHTRRAIGTAWQVSIGQVGGIIAVYAFISSDAPRYIPGYSISIAFLILSVILSVIYAALCYRENAIRAKKRAERGGGRSDDTEYMEHGDMALDFRYML